jgi:chemotaxis protein MotB
MQPPSSRSAVHHHGGVVFWGAASLIFAVCASYFYWQNRQHEQIARTLRSQEDLMIQENLRLKAEVDKLQSRIQETGGMLKNQQKTLQEAETNLAAAQAEKNRLAAEREAAANKKKSALETRQALVDRLQGVIEAGNISAEGDRLIVRLPGALLFAPGGVTLKEEGKAALAKFAATVLELFPDWNLAAEGHTDNEPIAGSLAKTYPSNWELSTARAASVTRFLIEPGKVPTARIAATGRGSSRPIATNDTPEGKAQNRRVEIILQPPATP